MPPASQEPRPPPPSRVKTAEQPRTNRSRTERPPTMTLTATPPPHPNSSAPPDRAKLPVFVLCGGLGTRLREETEIRPKPMVPVGSRPILWHIMRAYSAHGFRNFVLCLGYKAEVIKSYFL